jgi:transposase-like protein
MPENDRLNGCLNEIDLNSRDEIPKLLIRLGIQFHLAGLSLSNIILVLETFGVSRAQSAVHNWLHEADLQPRLDQNPDQVAVDETVTHLNDEQYWLYAAIDSQTNELIHKTRE